MSNLTVFPVPTEGTRLTVAEVGGDAHDVVGMSGISITSDPAPSRTSKDFISSHKFTGIAGPQSISINLQNFNPGLSVFQTLYDAMEDETEVLVSIMTREIPIFQAPTAAMVAIDATGDVTLSGTGVTHPKWGTGNYKRGTAFKTGAQGAEVYTVVDDWDANGVPECVPPAAAIAAITYSVVLPPYGYKDILCRVMDTGSPDMALESQTSATIALEPTTLLPRMTAGNHIT